VLVSYHGNTIDFPDLGTSDLLSAQSSDNQTTSEHDFLEIRVGQCCDMNIRHDSPDDKDPDIARILELDEEDDRDVEFQEARIIQ
jgi:hypothetical protein